jgi:hypothetical protein
MFGEAFSAAWVMLGFLFLLILMGIFTSMLGKMKGIKTSSGYLGAVFWVIGVIIYFVLAQVGSPDALILIAVSIVTPLLYLINLFAILFEKKHTWVDPDYKKKSLRHLIIFLGALVVWMIGLIIA